MDVAETLGTEGLVELTPAGLGGPRDRNLYERDGTLYDQDRTLYGILYDQDRTLYDQDRNLYSRDKTSYDLNLYRMISLTP